MYQTPSEQNALDYDGDEGVKYDIEEFTKILKKFNSVESIWMENSEEKGMKTVTHKIENTLISDS